MCSNFSKSEGKCLFAIKHEAQEAFDTTNLGQFNTINILKAYTSNGESSNQKDVIIFC